MADGKRGLIAWPSAWPALLHAVEGRLQDFPVLLALELGLCRIRHTGLEGVLGGTLHLIVDAELAREILAGQLVSGSLVGHVMILRHKKVLATLARVGGIEGARIKLGALTKTLNKAEPSWSIAKFIISSKCLGLVC